MAKNKGKKSKKTVSKTVKANSSKPDVVKKNKKTTIAEDLGAVKKENKSFSQQLKLSDSYVSLALGAAVVFVIAVLFFVVLKENKNKDTSIIPIVTPAPTPAPTRGVQKMEKQIYILKADESIWDIAVKFYGDGYKWTLIAEANDLGEYADYVEPGTELIIPPLK